MICSAKIDKINDDYDYIIILIESVVNQPFYPVSAFR